MQSSRRHQSAARAASVAAACEDGPWFGSPLAVPAGLQRVPEPRPFVHVILRIFAGEETELHIFLVSQIARINVCVVCR